jgi:ABC-type dipeptide/oligopeptide/nickel transport system permease component
LTFYIVRRLLWLPILLLIIGFITFVLGLYGPGDPVQVMLGQHSNPEAVARVRHELGLDRPLLVQYGDYVWKALHGDFGESIKYRGRPVGDLIGQRLWVSVQLNALVLILGALIGLPLGVLAALHPNSLLDYLIVGGVIGLVSIPTFTIAPILAWVFAVKWHLLPPGGWGGIFSRRIILPAVVLGSGYAAVFVRQTRANLLEVLSQDYVRTARAKGLRERTVVGVHALRNALIPLLTVFGLMVGGLVSGTFVTELIFGIPGIGLLGVDALFARDYPVIMALTLLVAASYTIANMLVDIGYGFLDPRIRHE